MGSASKATQGFASDTEKAGQQAAASAKKSEGAFSRISSAMRATRSEAKKGAEFKLSADERGLSGITKRIKEVRAGAEKGATFSVSADEKGLGRLTGRIRSVRGDAEKGATFAVRGDQAGFSGILARIRGARGEAEKGATMEVRGSESGFRGILSRIQGVRSEANAGAAMAVRGDASGLNAAAGRIADVRADANRGVTMKIDGDASGLKDSLASVTETAAGVAGGMALEDVGSGMADNFREASQAAGGFEGRLGASGRQAESLAGVGRRVFAGAWGESLGEVNSAVTTVAQGLGTMDNSAKTRELTEQALTLSDAFGMDVTESVEAARLMSQNMGISSERAFDLVAAGARRGANTSGDLLDTMREYPTYFSEMGLSGEQAMSMMAAGAERGIWNTDKLADSVKEFSIRAVDGSDTTKQGFQAAGLQADEMARRISRGGPTAQKAFFQTVSAINSIKDPIEREKAGVALFGTQFEDLGKKSLEAMLAGQRGMKGYEGATKRTGDSLYDNFTTRVTGASRTVQNFIGQAGLGGLGSALTEVAPTAGMAGVAVMGFGGPVMKVGGWAASAGGKVASMGGKALKAAGSGGLGALKRIAPVAGGALGKAGGAAVGAGGKLGRAGLMAAKLAGRGGLGLIIRMAPLVGTAFTVMTGPVGLAIAAVAAFAAGAYLVYKNWDKIGPWLGKRWEQVRAGVGSLKDWVVGKFGQLKDAALGRLAGIGSWFGRQWDRVRSGVSGLKDSVVGKFGELKDAAVGRLKSLASGVSGKVGQAKDAALGKLGELKNKGLAALGNLKSGAVSRFEAMKSGSNGKLAQLAALGASKLGGMAKTGLKNIGELAKGGVSKYQQLRAGGASRMEALRGAAGSVLGKAKTLALGNLGQMATKGVGLANKLKTGAINRYEEMRSGSHGRIAQLAAQGLGKFVELETKGLKSIGDFVGGGISDYQRMRQGGATRFEALRGSISGRLSEAKTQGSKRISELGGNLKTSFQNQYENARDRYQSMRDTVGDRAWEMRQRAGNAISAQAENLKTGFIGMLDLARGKSSEQADTVSENFWSMRNRAGNALGALRDGAEKVWTSMKEGASAFGTKLDEITGGKFSKTVNTARSWLGSLMYGVGNVLGAIGADDLAGKAKATAGSLKEPLKFARGGIYDADSGGTYGPGRMGVVGEAGDREAVVNLDRWTPESQKAADTINRNRRYAERPHRGGHGAKNEVARGPGGGSSAGSGWPPKNEWHRRNMNGTIGYDADQNVASLASRGASGWNGLVKRADSEGTSVTVSYGNPGAGNNGIAYPDGRIVLASHADSSTMAHEFGHMLGLDHGGNPSVMALRGSAGRAMSPTSNDFAALEGYYGIGPGGAAGAAPSGGSSSNPYGNLKGRVHDGGDGAGQYGPTNNSLWDSDTFGRVIEVLKRFRVSANTYENHPPAAPQLAGRSADFWDYAGRGTAIGVTLGNQVRDYISQNLSTGLSWTLGEGDAGHSGSDRHVHATWEGQDPNTPNIAYKGGTGGGGGFFDWLGTITSGLAEIPSFPSIPGMIGQGMAGYAPKLLGYAKDWLIDKAKSMFGSLFGGGSSAGGGATPGGPGDYGSFGSQEKVAQYMAGQAKQRGIPPELPVMTSLVESNLMTGPAVRFSDLDSAGPFQIRTQLHGWSTADAENYGLATNNWFLDNAEAYKGQYSNDAAGLGAWAQRVQGSAYPGRYQERYGEARGLIGYHLGGVIPGQPGQDVLIRAQAGERILSRANNSALEGLTREVEMWNRRGTGVLQEGGERVVRGGGGEPGQAELKKLRESNERLEGALRDMGEELAERFGERLRGRDGLEMSIHHDGQKRGRRVGAGR